MLCIVLLHPEHIAELPKNSFPLWKKQFSSQEGVSKSTTNASGSKRELNITICSRVNQTNEHREKGSPGMWHVPQVMSLVHRPHSSISSNDCGGDQLNGHV